MGKYGKIKYRKAAQMVKKYGKWKAYRIAGEAAILVERYEPQDYFNRMKVYTNDFLFWTEVRMVIFEEYEED